MKSAYNETGLRNLFILKEVKQWSAHQLLDLTQYTAIRDVYPVHFYHPNFIIRVLLFIATLVGLGGITGMLALIFMETLESIIGPLCIVYGIASFFVLDQALIKRNHHYKSGVTEALLYHAIGFTLGGIASLFYFDESAFAIWGFIIFGFAAYRYVDLVSTVCSVAAFAFLLFNEMNAMGGVVQQLIPVVLIGVFTPLYFFITFLKTKKSLDVWQNCLVVIETFSLLIIYAAGNYFVVREMSESLLGLEIAPGDDIPFAYLFYFLTVAIPVAYLLFALRNKDAVLLRISLAALAFSVFTFKYYYGFGHPEITLTVAGAILLLIAAAIFRYLTTPKHGFTQEKILSSKWSNLNAEAFIMSQTLGGNQAPADEGIDFGGGSFGGGGSGGNY